MILAAGIAAGCAYDAENEEYTFVGAAPGAQLVSMKIFHDMFCFCRTWTP